MTKATPRKRSRAGRPRTLDLMSEAERRRVQKEAKEHRERLQREMNERLDEMGLNDPGVSGLELASDPKLAVRELVATGDMGAAREYFLRTLHRMLLRGASDLQAARAFGVSQRTIRRRKRELRELMVQGLDSLTADNMLADSLAFYNEMRGMALQEATKYPLESLERRMAADGSVTERRVLDKKAMDYRVENLKLAVKAEADKHSMMEKMGVYEAIRFQPRNKEDNDTQRLAAMQDVLDGIMASEVPVEEFEAAVNDILQSTTLDNEDEPDFGGLGAL